jgi:cytochrome c oxidase subunit IV
VKTEAWIFVVLSAFTALITPVYWLMSRDPTGTVALILTFFLVLMVALYLGLIARRIDPRPEDKKSGEIAEGAGELGFFSPQSKWPLFVSLNFVLIVLGPVFG